MISLAPLQTTLCRYLSTNSHCPVHRFIPPCRNLMRRNLYACQANQRVGIARMSTPPLTVYLNLTEADARSGNSVGKILLNLLPAPMRGNIGGCYAAGQTPNLPNARTEFLNMAYYLAPSLRSLHPSSTVELLQLFLMNRTITPLLAKLCYNVMQIYQSTPTYNPYDLGH